ncbi:hypothetical protein BH23PAT1_BH23PAT1_5600 [soil metagenome]
MRLNAFLVVLLFAVVFFTAGSTTSHAQTQNETTSSSKQVVVKSGDTLSIIAKQHDTVYQRLFDANEKIENPDLIYAGEKIRIPHPNEQLKSRAPAPVSQPVHAPTEQQSPASTPAPVTTQAAPRPQPAPTQAPASSATVSGGVWDRVAMCESGGNWSINTGNGYYGGLQFSLSSWQAVGGNGYPHQASKAEQIARAERLLAIQGWGAWPACSSKLGLR